jgi:PAS domain S-box-containing protein
MLNAVGALRQRTPSIVLRFALYAGVALVVAVAVGVWIAQRDATSRARTEVSTDATFLATRLGQDDLARIAFQWPRGAGTAGLTAQLDDFLDPHNAARNVVRLSLATTDGIVTYSSDHALIGTRLARVPTGVRLVRRGGRQVLETWVPVRWALDPSRPRGFLGFDRSYAPVAAQIHNAFLVEAGTLALAVLLLYVAMLPIMHRLTGRLERALAEQRRLGAIVESSNDAIVGRDRDGLITSWNAAAERLYGWTATEALGKPIEFLVPLAKQDELEELAGDRELHLRKDKRLVLVSVSVSPIRDERGELAGSSLVVRDVTEVATLERELRRAQRQEAVARFATAMANELQDLVADLAPTDAGARGLALVRRLQEFGRGVELHPVEVDLNRLVLDLRGRLDRQLGRGVELTLELDAENATVWADKQQLQQVVVDLASSARDAMPDGGTLTIRTEDAGAFVRLALRDSGEARSSERLGLGLATVFGVVEQSGGSLEVESSPGAGTRVRVLLARPEAPAAARVA